MERNLNKEFRDYAEGLFFGLSMKQCGFAILALAASVIVYMLLIPYLSTEVCVWICIIAVAPIIALGFVRYQGMNCRELVKLAIRYYQTPKKLVFQGENGFYDILQEGGAFPHEDPKSR